MVLKFGQGGKYMRIETFGRFLNLVLEKGGEDQLSQ
jgi:hypothetical protein